MNTLSSASGRAPAHFWIVAVVGLAWNAFGAYDYTMSALRDPGYLAAFPPQMIEFLDLMPPWTIAAWAIGVWGALTGSLLMLARRRQAVWLFGLSLLGLAASSFYQFGAAIPESLRTTGSNAFTILIWITAVGLFLYASRMSREGVLR